MSDDNFQEDSIPTAEVEEFMSEPFAQPGPAEESGQPEPPVQESDVLAADFIPSQTKEWRYCLRDSSDETFWAVVFMLVLCTYVAEKFFGIAEEKLVGIPYHILTALFGIGILYFSIFLYKPFSIFKHRKEDKPDPNANHWTYDLGVFVIFVTSLLVFADRLILRMSIPDCLTNMLEICRLVIYAVFSVFVIGNFLSLMSVVFFGRICTYYQLTPVIFIMKTGFFVTKERHIAVWDIAKVDMHRNLWQRFLRVGTIELKVHSHGMDGAPITDDSLRRNARILYLRGLSNPKEVVDEFNHYRLFVRNHMGNRFISVMKKGVVNE